MPCRPAEYEFGMADGFAAYADSQSHIAHRARVRRVLKFWLSKGTVPPDLLPACKKLLAADLDESLPPPPSDTAVYPEPQDGHWALTLQYRVSREERQLCEERSLMANLTEQLGPPERYAQVVTQQLELHTEHCEGDRRAVLDALEHAIQRAPTSELGMLHRRRDQVRRLPIADIMRDREILKPFWP